MASTGEKIRKFREVYGLTQEELAEKVEMNRAYLSLIEAGHRRVTYETAVRLADVMRLPVEELYEAPAEKAGKP
jgi:transcriptional regulator with XRE-family HTH domain